MTTVSPDKDEVERVARAIAADQLKRRYGPGWDRLTRYGKAHLKRDATAAIAAMSPVDRLREALRPLSSAPTDGSYFLIVGDNFDGGMAVVRWNDDWWHLDDGKNFEIPLRGERKLKGWLPLPALSSPEPVGEA